MNTVLAYCRQLLLCLGAAILLMGGCAKKDAQLPKSPIVLTDCSTQKAVYAQDTTFPAPFASSSANNGPQVLGWAAGQAPTAPAGFTVTRYAEHLQSPRWFYQISNGDVLVVESNTGSSANRITLFRDVNHDGLPEERDTFLTGLNQPFGMLVLGSSFYVANTDGVMRYPYTLGQTKITEAGTKILDLPGKGYNNHWTRNLIANPEGTKIYVSVGSSSNVGENGMQNEVNRANILEINPDGTGATVFAYGLRNPVGMDWVPGTHTLWTAVNERDGLGDDLVPDYITSVKSGAFYGWPYSYYGQHVDPRRAGENPELVAKAIAPDFRLGAHTASLGLAFYKGTAFPQHYRGGAFVGQHGSWNRATPAGYRVVFVPFNGCVPSGPAEDFLTGFQASTSPNRVYGRPVGVLMLADGSLLVADDGAGIVWRVSAGS